MTIQFKDTLSWEQAQLLMQPTFIRVIDNLRKSVENSQWQGKYEEVQDPIPGYELHLTQGEREVIVNLWEFCFQICFVNYPSPPPEEDIWVEIDLSLLDDMGDIDWQKLEEKVKVLVEGLFSQLEG